MKKISANFCVALCTCLYFICESNSLFSQVVNDGITIIFNNTPKHIKQIEVVKNIFVNNDNPLILVKDNFHNIFFEPDSMQNADTLRIKPVSTYILLKHGYNTVSFMYYFFKKGDTVVFSYTDNIPKAIVINRVCKKYDINYDLSWKTKMMFSCKYTPYEIYLNPLLSDDKVDKMDIVNSYTRAKSRNYFLSKKLFLQEQIYLDSIKNVGEISEDYYNFYIDKCKYLAATIGVERGEISLEFAGKIKPSLKNTALPYSFYYNFLLANYYYNVERKAKLIFHSTGQIVDYRRIFSDIAKDSSIPSPYKDLLLHNYLNLIANNFSRKDFEKHFSLFQKRSTDSFLVNDIKARYITDLYSLKRLVSDTLFLIDETKAKYTLTDIIKKNRGKVIYIDFWASWCAPCRAAMSSSGMLRNKYKNEDIVFMYLSIDDDFTLWNKANIVEGLSQHKSFYILNRESSLFLQKIKLATIPRYLIFNKMGELIYQNAPGPKDEALKTLISNLTL